MVPPGESRDALNWGQIPDPIFSRHRECPILDGTTPGRPGGASRRRPNHLDGHAGTILLYRAADHAGLIGQLSAALRRKGRLPAFDLELCWSMEAAIMLGVTSMSDIALLAHLASMLGDAPIRPTVRPALHPMPGS
jgi:hypothetical protein